jgi:hypothetical protein
MKLFKRKKDPIKQRLLDLELYLGIAYAEDGYGGYEHIEKRYGELVELNKDVKALKEKAKI